MSCCFEIHIHASMNFFNLAYVRRRSVIKVFCLVQDPNFKHVDVHYEENARK